MGKVIQEKREKTIQHLRRAVTLLQDIDEAFDEEFKLLKVIASLKKQWGLK